jgi:hypothetical protein
VKEEETAISPAIAIPIPSEVSYADIISSLPKFQSNIRYLDSILLKAAIQ